MMLPITTIPEIPADGNAIGKSMRAAKAMAEAASDSNIKQALVAAVQEWEDEGGSLEQSKAPPTKSPAKQA